MMGRQLYMEFQWVWVICILSALWALCAGCPQACECKWKGGKQTVECRSQGLITLPSPIDPATQVLDLSRNNLQILPREVFSRANLLNLQKIFLHGCRIGQLDANALKGLTNLVELDLSDNLLTAIPTEAFRETPSLRELRLNSNPIQKIDDRAFQFLPGLVKLDLSDCQIETIAPRSFEGLQQLSHLRLGKNKLTEIKPRVVTPITRLHGIELHNNPWICDCRLRFMRDWLQQYNIPTPVSPTCSQPHRLAGRPLLDLPLDEFACPPEVSLSSIRLIESKSGDNATLSCSVTAVPAPFITWLWRGYQIGNMTNLESAGVESSDRIITVLEEGTTEKTSRLVLSPVRETDSGEYICVATNAAGITEVNFTLHVEVRAPVAVGFGSAQIAGLSAGLFLLLAISLSVFCIMIVRYRDTTSRSKKKKQPPTSNQNGLTDMVTHFKPTTGTTNTIVSKASTPSPTTNNPDLIYEARKAVIFWSQNKEESVEDGVKEPVDKETCHQGDCLDQGYNTNDGGYQSVQTESLYPSELWPRTSAGVGADASPVFSNTLDTFYADRALMAEPQTVTPVARTKTFTGREFSNAESETESISNDSYSQPRCIPQYDPTHGGYFPYPSDFGLPRSNAGDHFATLPHSRTPVTGRLAKTGQGTLPSSYRSKKSSHNASADSSPASSARSVRFWHRPTGTGERHFARDSPDEGYQEECATDV